MHHSPAADRVALNDFHRQWQEIADEVHTAVERVGTSGYYILGRAVREFEHDLARFLDVPWCIGVASGHDALEIALRSLGLGPGQRVLTTPLSAFATTQAILRAGGAPVFVDVDASGLLDLSQCEEAIASDPSLRFLLPVHLWGHAADLDHIERLRDGYGVTVVEDCAQSIGARWRGRLTGTVGQATAISFYPTKNLGALGDGGALLGASRSVKEVARRLRDYGQSEQFVHDDIGLNSRLDELHAAILQLAMMPRLGRWTTRRQEIAHAYREGIDHPQLTIPPVEPANDPVWHLFPILVPGARRDAFRTHMEGGAIDTAVHYPRLIPDQPALAGRADVHVVGPLDNARSFAREEVSLPIHPHLTDKEVARVITACNGWRT